MIDESDGNPVVEMRSASQYKNRISLLGKRKLAIVGLGVNNRKLAEYFGKQGVKFDIIDGWENSDELLGKLDRFDIIFRSPGLPYLSNVVQQAKSAGVEISSQTKLFFRLCPAKIIGVTGTKGKGTTASLIAEILDSAGKRFWLGGNIGTDPFEFIDQIKSEDFVVLELSSFQLQDLDQSPQIAVVLSITPDHLNHHKNFEEYILAKSRVIKNQTDKDFSILHPTLPDWFKSLGNGRKIFIEPESVEDFERKLIGKHNLDNIAAAVAVAKVLEISMELVKKTVASFEPLPHRLNMIKEVNGVKYFDDGFSTNIEPTVAAIDAIDSPLILIVGGSEKGLDFASLGEKIKSSGKVKGVVAIGATTDKILKSLDGFNGQILTEAQNMTEILDQAKRLAKSGDAILFSPGTASFGIFKNEYDRAEQFVKGVNSL